MQKDRHSTNLFSHKLSLLFVILLIAGCTWVLPSTALGQGNANDENSNDRIFPVAFTSELTVLSVSNNGRFVEPFGLAFVGVNVTNDSPGFQRDLAIVTLFEIRDPRGVTMFIASQSDILRSSTDKELGIDWPVPGPGRFQVRAFVISNFTNPEILSGTVSSNISVEMPVGSKFGIGPVITQSESQNQGFRRALE